MNFNSQHLARLLHLLQYYNLMLDKMIDIRQLTFCFIKISNSACCFPAFSYLIWSGVLKPCGCLLRACRLYVAEIASPSYLLFSKWSKFAWILELPQGRTIPIEYIPTKVIAAQVIFSISKYTYTCI